MKLSLSRSYMALLPATFLVLTLTACASTPGVRERTAPDATVWQSRDQFVRIGPREHVAGDSVQGNDHPVTISARTLRHMLSGPRIIDPETGKPAPLFTETEVGLLSEHVSAGLSRCSRDEEIVFAIYGYHPTLMGLVREERVTTGRFFHRGGELNLILGMVQQPVESRGDRRLAPFTPGSRTAPAQSERSVIPGTMASNGRPDRTDWLVFRIGSEQVGEQLPDQKSANAPPVDDKGGSRGIEERLRLLKSLRDRDLISEEEYRTKKQQILNEL